MRSLKSEDGSYCFDLLTNNSQQREINRFHRQLPRLMSVETNIWRNAGLTDGMQVVDLGCGTGAIACEIASQFPDSYVRGIDRSQVLLNIANSIQTERNIANISFSQGDATAIDLPDGTIDFVYGRLLFQHLPKPIAVLGEIARILKPGGKLCIVDVADSWFVLSPEPPGFGELRQRLLAIQTTQGGDGEVGYKLGNYLSEAGFSDIQTNIEVVTSDRLGSIEQFLDLLSFGSPYYAIAPDLEVLANFARASAAKLLELPHAWGAFALFIATGSIF